MGEANVDSRPSDLAAAFWHQLRPGCPDPSQVEAIQEEGARSVYRLHGVGRDGAAVIAKRSRYASALLEGTIYEEVLPKLPLPHIHLYGLISEPDGRHAWLFMEDAAGAPYSPANDEHRAHAGAWLGSMHVATAGLEPPNTLEDAGPIRFEQFLPVTRETIGEVITNPLLRRLDTDLLHSIDTQFQMLAGHWDDLARFCNKMPRTLVHGDFKEDNLRVHCDVGQAAIMMFDWHEAGWGAPALDVAKFLGYSINPDVTRYCEVVRELWPWMDVPLIYRLGFAGEVFRSVASIRWEVERLRYQWIETPLQNLRIFSDWLTDVIHAEPWAEHPSRGPDARSPKARTWH